MRSTRKTILVADDNDDLRDLLELIVGAEGCSVIQAADGAQAVEKASLAQPDLILMDIRMPIMDGYEATRRILSTTGLSNIPVVAISAHCTGEWKRRALEAGCVECVPKPIQPDELHDIIGRYIGDC